MLTQLAHSYRTVKLHFRVESTTCNPQMKEKLQELKEKISDYRDYQISHNQNMRSIYSVGTDGKNNVTIGRNTLYPKETDDYISSSDIETITNLISDYLRML